MENSHWFERVLRFALPWSCASCRTALPGLEDEGFCGRCWLTVPRIMGLVCDRCGVPLREGGKLCSSCKRTPYRVTVRSATLFEGPLRSAVHRFKYAGRPSLAGSLGRLLSWAWDNNSIFHDIQGLVPVPSHQARQRERGYNQAELLANQLSSYIGKPILASLLLRASDSGSQTTKGKFDRIGAVSDAFRTATLPRDLQDRLRGLRVLLIDDVCTTGSTLSACADTLRKLHIRASHALTVARER